MERKIYLDNSATTPIGEAAKRAMLEAMEYFGNPSSLHTLGQRAERLVSEAREMVLSGLGCSRAKGELVFTSCGTEATSLAIFGTAFAKTRREATRILTTDSEHPATAEALNVLNLHGFEIVKIPTLGGTLDLDFLESALDKKIFMASFMLVNNETGALYSLKRAFEMIRRRYPDAITHCDAIQGFMRTPFTPAGIGAQLVSLSGHKIHAPKGVGALYISPELIKAKRIQPFLRGGGQEKGLRSGTENVIGISAFGAAVREMLERRTEISHHMEALYAYACQRLDGLGLQINRPQDHVNHIINVTLPSIKSETMLHHLSADGIYVSSGSACSSHSNKPSEALIAFGLTPQMADCSLRLSFSPLNTESDIDILCESLTAGLERIVRIKR